MKLRFNLVVSCNIEYQTFKIGEEIELEGTLISENLEMPIGSKKYRDTFFLKLKEQVVFTNSEYKVHLNKVHIMGKTAKVF